MISAWRKLVTRAGPANGEQSATNGAHSAGRNLPSGIQKLDKELQRKFARGVNYNMKVVIKGDSQVGKSSLFLRLKGYGFREEYLPTESLDVTSIDWNYKTTNDIVKIDLWEAVDAANSKKTVTFVDLKTENDANGDQSNSAAKQSVGTNGNREQNNNGKLSFEKVITTTKLVIGDSRNASAQIPESTKKSLAELSDSLDVYRGANAVLLVMNMTKLWTFNYVQTELGRIPKHLPVLVIANHRDQGHHRCVTADQVETFIASLDRGPNGGAVIYTEASMRNGFGMKLIERFFNIPFLKLQESTLLKQLELNRIEYLESREELKLMQEETNKEYENYLELQTIKRRQKADALSPINSGFKQLDNSTREQIRGTTVSSESLTINPASVRSIMSSPINNSQQQQQDNKFVNDRSPSIVIGAKCPLPTSKPIQMSRGSIGQEINGSNKPTSAERKETEGGADGNDKRVCDSDESDQEEDEVPHSNPLVANYQSDLDSDDQIDAPVASAKS